MRVALDGIHGCGKSTVLSMLASTLQGAGIKIHTTAWNSDPDWHETAGDIRRAGRVRMPEVFTLLELTDLALRTDLLATVSDKDLILADRDITTAIARALSRGLDEELVLKMCHFAGRPEFLAIIDVPVDIAIRRSKPLHDRSWKNGFGIEPSTERLSLDEYLSYQQAFRENLLKAGAMLGARVYDGRQPPVEVAAAIMTDLRPLLPNQS